MAPRARNRMSIFGKSTKRSKSSDRSVKKLDSYNSRNNTSAGSNRQGLHSESDDGSRPIDQIRIVQRVSTEEPSVGATTVSETAEMSKTNNSNKMETDEWAEKLKSYEKKRRSGHPSTSMGDERKTHIKALVRQNLWKLAREEIAQRDPRNQILTFFNDVAQEGAQHVEEDGNIETDTLHPLLKTFNRASVFTVWRPTSMEAKRKMICGEAVGKGLDIKGKSAKRGTLSGFVPFLQISENRHKSKITGLTKDGRIRLFFMGEKNGEDARDFAKLKLRQVLKEMKSEAGGGSVGGGDGEMRSSSVAKRYEMSDETLRYIDDYVPARYGLDIPVKLFWEAYIQRQDISRKKGSHYDTGRPSAPSFQDMNLATMNKKVKKGDPRPVILQHADFLDSDSPMNPFELIIAYENEDMRRVAPVVSDFDCFLVGTRRVTFKSPLGSEEAKVLGWCIDECEKILANQKPGQSWTNLWCDVLKDAAAKGFSPKVPKFGFGDPKSYSIMENAVRRLNVSGAVRHGAECFNYIFPQDLDDKFLVIGPDRVPGKVPWKYVDETGLLDILHDHVDNGYTFPMNPKWVLCDGGRWRDLYNKLMVNDNENTIDSMNVWYPRKGGIREKMRRIMATYPGGFDPEAGASSHHQVTIDPDEVKINGLAKIQEGQRERELAELNSLIIDNDYTFPIVEHRSDNDGQYVLPVKWLLEKWYTEVPQDVQIVVNYSLLFLMGILIYYLCDNSLVFAESHMDVIGTKIGYTPRIIPCDCGDELEESIFSQMYTSAVSWWQ